jgi:CMP-N-acetylneuraminic acid synthetase
MVVSVILARGGSKGIPRKNIVDINGKPLLYYTIEASLKSGVDATWVSTDDEEIATIAYECGARVLKRPAKISTDKSTSESALMHFAEQVEFDHVVFIQPTSPLLKAKYIDEGLSMTSDYDSIFSAYIQHWTPRWTKELPSKPIGWDPNNRPRRQDADEVYIENGSFYITSKEALLKSGVRFSGRIGVVEMPLGESYQIDTYEDLEFIKRVI